LLARTTALPRCVPTTLQHHFRYATLGAARTARTLPHFAYPLPPAEADGRFGGIRPGGGMAAGTRAADRHATRPGVVVLCSIGDVDSLKTWCRSGEAIAKPLSSERRYSDAAPLLVAEEPGERRVRLLPVIRSSLSGHLYGRICWTRHLSMYIGSLVDGVAGGRFYRLIDLVWFCWRGAVYSTR